MADSEQEAEVDLHRAMSGASSNTGDCNNAKRRRERPDEGRVGSQNKSLKFEAEFVEQLKVKISKAGSDGDIISIVERTFQCEQQIFPSAMPIYSKTQFDTLKIENPAVETKCIRLLLFNMLLKDYFTSYQCSFAPEVAKYYTKIATCIHLAAASSSTLLAPNWVRRKVLCDILRPAVHEPACVLDLPADVVLAMVLRLHTLSKKGRGYGGSIIPLIASGKIQALAEKIWVDRNVLLPAIAEHVLCDDDFTTVLVLAKRMKEVEEQHFKSIGEGMPMSSVPAKKISLELVHQFIGGEERYEPTSWLKTRVEIARIPQKHPRTTTACSCRRSLLRLSQHPNVRMVKDKLDKIQSMAQDELTWVRARAKGLYERPRKEMVEVSPKLQPEAKSGTATVIIKVTSHG
jgi:hypothetical protein